MTNHRIQHQEILAGAGRTRHTVWNGDDVPTHEEIEDIKQRLKDQLLESGEPKDPFRQEVNDMIMVQRQRTPQVLGWATIALVNIYE